MKIEQSFQRILSILTIFIAVSGGGLVSCGGGGSSGASNPPVPASSSSLTAVSSASSSISSAFSSLNSSQASLVAPVNISAVPGNGSVNLSWNAVPGASGYRIYYASDANIIVANIASFADGTSIEATNSPHLIGNLRNGETYYFVVTALHGNQESVASSEVSATPDAIDVTQQPSAQEVLVVELINRARANPPAEATRLGIGLNDGISGTQISNDPKPPVAHNLLLIEAARTHSQWMLNADVFSHTGNNNSTPRERMQMAGYVFTGSWASGENISFGGTTAGSINLTTYAVSHHDGLFKSPGHRLNILSNDYREIGVGQRQGYFLQNGTNYLSSMLTQNFARSGAGLFLTGVVYDDKNNNEFYDVGEGLSGISITTNGKTYSVFNSGAYSIPLANGNYELSITGDALGTPVFYSVQISNRNRKLDVIKTGANVRVVTP